MYTISVWALFLDQLVLCYLFYTFSAPVTGKIDISSSGEMSVSFYSSSVTQTLRQSQAITNRSSIQSIHLLQPEVESGLQSTSGRPSAPCVMLDEDQPEEDGNFQKFMSNMWGEREAYFRQTVFTQFARANTDNFDTKYTSKKHQTGMLSLA